MNPGRKVKRVLGFRLVPVPWAWGAGQATLALGARIMVQRDGVLWLTGCVMDQGR